jgi:hypothetical protein
MLVLLNNIGEHMPTTANYSYRTIKTLEQMAETVGFEISDSMTGYSNDGNLCLVPKNERLPIYTRGCVIAKGSAEELIAFLQGWMKMKEYVTFLKLVDDKKIDRKEKDYRNARLAKMIKDGKKPNEQ